MIYSVEITEKFSKVVKVKADNYDDAVNYVSGLYDDGKITLGHLDFLDVDYSLWYKYDDPSIKYDYDLTGKDYEN